MFVGNIDLGRVRRRGRRCLLWRFTFHLITVSITRQGVINVITRRAARRAVVVNICPSLPFANLFSTDIFAPFPAYTGRRPITCTTSSTLRILLRSFTRSLRLPQRALPHRRSLEGGVVQPFGNVLRLALHLGRILAPRNAPGKIGRSRTRSRSMSLIALVALSLQLQFLDCSLHLFALASFFFLLAETVRRTRKRKWLLVNKYKG